MKQLVMHVLRRMTMSQVVAKDVKRAGSLSYTVTYFFVVFSCEDLQ